QAARVQLGDDAVDAELFPQFGQALDHALRRAERDLLRQDVLVRETRHAVRLEPAAVGWAGAGTTDGRARELRLAREERREALARLFDRRVLRRRDVDRDAQVGAGLARMAGLAPCLAKGRERRLEVRDL